MSTIAATAVALGTTTLLLEEENERVILCEGLMRNYTHNTATVEQQQEYSKCVGMLHPTTEEVAGGILVFKIFIVWSLVSLLIGGIRDDFDRATGAMMGLMYGWFLLIIIGAVCFLFLA